MNALLIYPQLPLSFFSFEKISGEKATQPPLSLLTVAALLPVHWNLRLLDMNTRQVKESDWLWADIVMSSAMLVQKRGLLEIVSEANRRGKTIVAGGSYPTLLPQEVLDAGCDHVVRGEAENTIQILLNALTRGEGPRIIESTDKPDLSTSPIPRFDLVSLSDYSTMGIQASRGCPYNCEFCDIVEMFGRVPRYKTGEQVVSELSALYKTGYTGTVFVADDNFIGDRRRAKNILEHMTLWNKRVGEPFGYITQASVNLGMDLELIDLMTAANFGEIFIGLETPDVHSLEGIGKTQNLKNSMVESVNNIKKNGLMVLASFIIGFDRENHRVAQQICNLVEQTDVPIAVINHLMAVPHTRLWRRLEKEGRLVDIQTMPDIIFSEFNFTTQRPEAEILEDFSEIWRYLYEPSRLLARTYRYYTAMRPTRRAMAISNGVTPPIENGPHRFYLRNLLKDIKCLLYILWKQGVVRACRKQFWDQLFLVIRKNPSRLKPYLRTCGRSEWMFKLVEMVTINSDAMAAKYRMNSLGASASVMPPQTKG
jgi:radical SAM superfamily enzyme YgiQ (UPF0313 family)